MNYIVPAQTVTADLKVKNSRFIASAGYTPSVEAAKAFIVDVKKMYADASHNVPAYIVGHGASIIEHCNDDGEPGGTAGRPILAVLKGSGFGDITVVVTRYFGGTKLGTGGLVQAYSSSVKDVLSQLPKARKTWVVRFELTMPYSHYEPVKRAVETHGGTVSNERFTADVRFDAVFEEQAATSFADYANDRWGGDAITLEQKETIRQLLPAQ